MDKIIIDETVIDKKNKIKTWDDWDNFEKEVFKCSSWEETDIDTLGRDLERPIVIIDSYEWNSTTNSYNLPSEVLHFYEKTRREIFARLEPEAAANNMSHPEWYAKWCVYCKIWSEKYPKEKCPKCGNELLLLALND